MKKGASFLILAVGFVLAVTTYSCQQSVEAPSGPVLVEPIALSKPVKADLVDFNDAFVVVGNVMFSPGRGEIKVTVSITDGEALLELLVYQDYEGPTSGSGVLGTITTNARGRGRFSGTIDGLDAGTYNVALYCYDVDDHFYGVVGVTEIAVK
jgi:hypothetical protein